MFLHDSENYSCALTASLFLQAVLLAKGPLMVNKAQIKVKKTNK